MLHIPALWYFDISVIYPQGHYGVIKIETVSALLALCEGFHYSPHEGPVSRTFDVPWSEQRIEQTLDWPVIRDAMMVIWRRRYVSYSQICCNTLMFCITVTCVKCCHTTGSGCYNLWANIQCSGCSPLKEIIVKQNSSIPDDLIVKSPYARVNILCEIHINSLWPSDTIRWHRSW